MLTAFVLLGAAGALAQDGERAVPTIRASTATVGPAYPKAVIHRVIRRERRAIRQCFLPALEREPGLAGRVVLRFSIGRDGRVRSPAIESSTLGSSEVERCIVRQSRRWAFPEPWATMHVRYPFDFAADGTLALPPVR